ncbi:hypothetical protein GP486_005022 [Trichoglossum hirsutum]|uniref:DUF6594 domain-containing protein n=1 Tax=Trichoglossum hirsutum TaxID=265104 RepID=A0A9P8RNI3_9PEZI|nr:hypothetical protein GP486_005022 [Trichoglossum hirsutum]
MTASRDSTSSRGSDLSVTACDPNSRQTTPTNILFPTEAAGRTSDSINSSSGSEEEYDITKDLNNPVEGWPRVALLMAKTPDFAAFSRFRDLNIKSLLYYQAQLTNLRNKLHEKEYEDARGTDEDRRQFASRADFLMCSEESDQLKLVREIRIILKEYSMFTQPDIAVVTLMNVLDEALLQYSQISALAEPDIYNMKNLRKWLRHRNAGNFCIGGDGEQNIWGDLYTDPDEGAVSLWRQFWTVIWTFIWPQPLPTNDSDLVMTRPTNRVDGFTRWVACCFIPFYEDFCRYREEKEAEKLRKRTGPDLEKHSRRVFGSVRPENWVSKVEKQKTLETWSEKGMLRFTSSVSTVVACLLPTVAITVLSQVNGTRNLLLCVAGFAVMFAAGLIFLTNGTSSRVEIFTATAA